METRANYVAVGVFTILAIVAAFALVYWTAGYSNRDSLVPLEVRIAGSVSGLGPGSLVQFNGITVGRVEDLSLDTSDPRFVVVHTRVDINTPVRQDTKASVGLRGLSGGAFISLEGGTAETPALLRMAAEAPDKFTPRIEGDPSAISDLMERVNTIANQAERTMETLNNFVEMNQKNLTSTFENVDRFTAALAANSDGVSEFMASAGEAAKALEGLSGKIDATISHVERVVEAVEPNSVAATIDNVTVASAKVRTVLEDVDAESLNTILSDLQTTSSRLAALTQGIEATQLSSLVDNVNATAEQARSILAGIDGTKVSSTLDDISATATGAREIVTALDRDLVRQLVADVTQASSNVSALTASIDANRVNRAVSSITEAAEGAQQVVTDVRGVTKQIAGRGPDVEKVIDDAVALSARLNETSKKLDTAVERVNDLIGSDATNGIVSDVQNTLAEFRNTAKTLAVEVSRIGGSVDGFAKRGLGDTQTLIRDARRSIGRIDRVIRKIEDNPSALISGSGGSRIRETTGGRPRR